jgi:hypothetical protein
MTVLSKAKPEDVVLEPFPHIVIHDAIDEALCDELISCFPRVEDITKTTENPNNARFSMPAVDAISDSSIAQVWQDFVRSHTSQEFWNQWLDLFAESIRNHYPNFESTFGNLASLKAGLRKVEGESADIQCDAQICINTPVTTQSRVRGAHVDLANKIYAGLFYMRHPDDDSTGGELEIIRARNLSKLKFDGQFASYDDVEVIKTVPYRKNVLVMFLNCETALHGVTERSVTNSPRMFMNLVGEVSTQLFTLPQKSFLSKKFGRPIQTT